MHQNVHHFVLKEEHQTYKDAYKTTAMVSLGRKKPKTEITYKPSKRRKYPKPSNQAIH
jgi:hypothetical protein